MNHETATLIRALPCFSGIARIAALDGGMTNRNYRVDDGRGRYVVRLGQDVPEHGILRWHELAAARAAWAIGLSPEVVFAAPGVLVSRFVDGRTLQPQDLRDAARLDAVVDLLHRCHRDMPARMRGPVLMFWVFQVIRDYLARLQAEPGGLLQDRLAAIAAMTPVLEAAVGPVQIVFGHNDMLAGNLIDDGDRLWLIDWDYAGFNSPLFDLANLSCNNGLDTALDHALLTRYFGCAPDAARNRAFLAMRCASAVRETLWAMVSQQVSTIDFDYAAYARNWGTRLDQTWQTFQASERDR
ncbi:MAG TPA: phosphotransferase [Burkholderiaceae bacterium]|nr:phosphotransferase [Burkholderiaceae bacterium]